MSLIKYSVFFLIFEIFLYGTPKEVPFKDLEALIHSTEELVTKQKALREKLNEYQGLHDAYLLDMENKELLLKTANSAKKVLETIKEEKLAPLFDPSFISEMTLFAKLAKSPCIPPLP